MSGVTRMAPVTAISATKASHRCRPPNHENCHYWRAPVRRRAGFSDSVIDDQREKNSRTVSASAGRRPLRVAVVDSDAYFRRGVVLELARAGWLANALASPEDLQFVEADVVLAADDLGDGSLQRTIDRVRVCSSDAAIVVLAGNPGGVNLAIAANAGVNGYVAKTVSTAELLAALLAAAEGDRPVVLRLDDVLVNESYNQRHRRPPRLQLTARELTILCLLGAGAATPDIAAELQLTADSTRKTISRLFKKLGIRNRAEAAALASRGTFLQYEEDVDAVLARRLRRPPLRAPGQQHFRR
jgi:DNA-binding NarL/FixJ family response regulator